MPLNPGLTETEICERVNRLVCPMCQAPLRVLIRREWATCHCCGVDYAKALDGNGVEQFVCRYLPDGEPRCQHYQAQSPPLTRTRTTLYESRLRQRGL